MCITTTHRTMLMNRGEKNLHYDDDIRRSVHSKKHV